MPRVVDLRVVVEHGAREPVGGQRRGAFQRAAGGQVPVMRHRPAGSLHRVVQDQARPDVGALDHLLVQRVHEGNRLDQVRGELGHEQVAFPQGLVDELEVELLQVPQAAVDELARPAGGARGQVARLHQGHPQPPGRRVQGGPRARDAAADDQHVEPLGRQPAEHRGPVAGVESAVTRHHPSPMQLRSGPTSRVCTSSTCPQTVTWHGDELRFKRRCSGRFRRGHRSGHHEHEVHALRSFRCRSGQAPAGAHADHAPARLGGAQPDRDLGTHQRRHHDRAERQRTCAPPTWPRSA